MKRILMVDDEEAILLAFSKVLSGPAVSVDTSTTAEEARQLLETNSYAAVIADLRLTGATIMEGFQVVEWAKKLQPQSRILVITAYAGHEAREKVFVLGADLCLEKPISPHKVRDILSTMRLYE